MNPKIFAFLKKYSSNPMDIDRLIVSGFLQVNNLNVTQNKFLKSYLIEPCRDDEYKISQLFKALIDKYHGNFTLEYVISLFEYVVSPADRIITGAVYTPEYIREFICENALRLDNNERSDIKIVDMSCGCGGFLITAAVILKKQTNKKYSEIFESNIYGLDIQNYSITRSKILLSLLALCSGEDEAEFTFNLYEGDALEFRWQDVDQNFDGFTSIVGNPPYVCSRNIENRTKLLLKKWKVCDSGHPDLYIPFFQIGLENLRTNGKLAFITMNTFFKSVNGRSLRKYFQDYLFALKIIDFGKTQIFKSKNTYTCICFIDNKQQGYIEYARHEIFDTLAMASIKFNCISYSELRYLDGWNLQENTLISKIEATGTPFGKLYKTRNGIATLKNSVYIFKPIREDKRFYYLHDEQTYKIEKGICRDIFNPNVLTVKSTLRYSTEKIIFPYLLDDESTATLIQENLFKTSYPEAYAYLESKKKALAGRDKAKGNYQCWYAFGRNQSLEKFKYKLFFPHITPRTPNFLVNSDQELMFYNGMAVIGEDRQSLFILKKLMQSRLFWFYIVNSSKPYGSSYYSLSRNYIKNFGIFEFSKEDRKYILSEGNKDKLNAFFERKYNILL